jgi:DNA-binding SARP family transcriptional activator
VQQDANRNITYRQQFTRCGKQRCQKCRQDIGHGPYWYAYWSEGGRVISKYVGVHLPAELAQLNLASGKGEKPESLEVRIYTFGGFRVERKVGTVWRVCQSSTWERRRARSLLGCLLSSRDYRLGREEMMEALWPGLDHDTAANRLHGAVRELRLILEPELARPAESHLLRLEHDTYELVGRDLVWVDADAFEDLLKGAREASTPQHTEHILEEAASLYRGVYLQEELYAQWAAPRRDALRRGWTDLLFTLAHLRTERGDLVGAIEALDRLRADDPTDETSVQQLMLLLMRLNRRGEALQVYRQHVLMLRRDEESKPLPETHALYRELLQGHTPTSYVTGVAPHEGLPFPSDLHEEKRGTDATADVPQNAPKRQGLSFLRPPLQLIRMPTHPFAGRERELDALRMVMLALVGTLPDNSASTHHDADRSGGKKAHLASPAQVPLSGPVQARQEHVILLQGEPGIGKTRLAEELSKEAHAQGWAVVWGRVTTKPEEAIPYGLWRELLGTLLKGCTYEDAMTQSGMRTTKRSLLDVASTEASHYHSIRERLVALVPEHDSAPVTSSTDAGALLLPEEYERLRIWEATLELLGMLSRINPILLVFDDLYAADKHSLELLAYLARHLDRERILLVGTCGKYELSPSLRLNRLFTNLRREQAISFLLVGPLTEQQISMLASPLPKAAVQLIQTQASGNPLIAEELARQWKLDKGTSEPAEGSKVEIHDHVHPALPAGVLDVFQHRLAQLSEPCQAFLRKAAGLGGPFELDQLSSLYEEHDEETTLDLLEEALHARLIMEDGAVTSITYQFCHPLFAKYLAAHST